MMSHGGPLFGLLANPGGRREHGFVRACAEAGLPAPRVIPWRDWLSRDDAFREASLSGLDALRIDTPAEDDAVERLLLAAGYASSLVENAAPSLSPEECAALPPDDGVLRHQRQWFYGWYDELMRLHRSLRNRDLAVMNQPLEIIRLFDKLATRDFLEEAGVPMVPGGLICDHFRNLLQIMDERGWEKVFLKPCYGSSASGVMAISRRRRSGSEVWKVVTSARLDPDGRIRNLKQLRVIDDLREIQLLVDGICLQYAIVERWFPKATLQGRSFDLRVVVIAGNPAHIAVRTSAHPITNLHLRNTRGDLNAVIASLGEAKWLAALDVARRAAAAFPGCHYCGVDLMIGAGGHGVAVAEVNAFGDLLHHETCHGMSTWRAELESWKSRA